MGTIRFVLRSDKASNKGLSPVELIYQVNGKRKYLRTKEKLYSSNWDDKEQKAVYLERKKAKEIIPPINLELLPTAKEVEAINIRLQHFKKEILDIEDRFELDQIPFSPEMVIDKLKGLQPILNKIQAPSNQVFDFIDKYIEDNKESREPGSLSVYRSLKNHLHNFQVSKNKKVVFDDMNYSFFKEFQNHLITARDKKAPNGLSNVTIAKQLSTLKTFLNYARMHGFVVSDKYKDFKIKKETLEVIALTQEEFDSLFYFDFSKNKRLDQVRDVFCFSCATGLRYSDLHQLKREHIKSDEIRLTVTKTKERLTIPLNPFSKAILDKYKDTYQPLPVISNQKMNDYIKEVCKEVEINEPVQIVRFRGTRREEKSFPKYELISVHTGRKTFCTLSLEKGMSAEEVMQISGHKDYQSFKRYVNITEKRSKIVMSKAWGDIKKTILKAV